MLKRKPHSGAQKFTTATTATMTTTTAAGPIETNLSSRGLNDSSRLHHSQFTYLSCACIVDVDYSTNAIFSVCLFSFISIHTHIFVVIHLNFVVFAYTTLYSFYRFVQSLISSFLFYSMLCEIVRIAKFTSLPFHNGNYTNFTSFVK